MDAIKYDVQGLVPVVTQDVGTGAVLMLAYANAEALQRTMETGQAVYFSRSRQALWHKGATSGNVQHMVAIQYDCDADTLLYQVTPAGPACHTGAYTCFDNAPPLYEAPGPKPPAFPMLHALESIVHQRKEAPEAGSYTNYLFAKGTDKILKKVGEEAAEVIIAAKNNSKTETVNERRYDFHR